MPRARVPHTRSSYASPYHSLLCNRREHCVMKQVVEAEATPARAAPRINITFRQVVS